MAVKKQINTAETEARIDTLTLPQDGAGHDAFYIARLQRI